MKKKLSVDIEGYRTVVELTNWFKDQLKEIHENGSKAVTVEIKYE